MLAVINTDLTIKTLGGELITVSRGYSVRVDVIYHNLEGAELAVVSDSICLGMVIPTEFLSYEYVH